MDALPIGVSDAFGVKPKTKNLPRFNRKQHYLRWDTEADGDDAGADSGCHEEVVVVFDHMAPHVAIAVLRGFNHTTNQWKSDLAAVRVAGEEEWHTLRQVREDVRVVRQGDEGLSFRHHRYCVCDGLPARPEICEANEPEFCAAHIEMYDFVFENLNSILLQTATHLYAAVPPIVIA